MDDTAWHNIVAWRSLADLAQKYIRKGTQVFLIGHLTYRKYTDNNGVERSVTEIVADKIELCGIRQEASPTAEVQVPKNLQKPFMDDNDDLPPSDGMPF